MVAEKTCPWIQRTVVSQNKPRFTWQKLQTLYFLPQLIVGHLSTSSTNGPLMHNVGLWHIPLCNRNPALVFICLLFTQVQLHKDTWIMAWIMKKVTKLFWSFHCQSQFVFSLPPSGHGLMFYCCSTSQGVSGSILLKMSMRLSSPHR